MDSENKYLKKNTFVFVLGLIAVVLIFGVISYAFFNYTRTGNANTLKVGRIAFNSTQDNTINLVNVFPTSTEDMDSTNSSTVTINIEGDTTYSDGIEYRVIIDQVNNTVNGKEIPISFGVTANNLGDRSNDYYNDRGDDTNVYNLVELGDASDGELILIGYIKPDNVGVDGSIDITAYLDKDKIGISDTVSRIDNGNLIYGETGGDWIAGRTILTTTEWNSLQTNGISFKVKVEANEGIWIPEPKFNVLKNLKDVQDWQDIKASITSIEFSTNPEIPANAITSFDATDITSDGEVKLYTLDDGLGNNTYKAIICAADVIYAPEDSMAIFSALSKLTTFNSGNFRVDNATTTVNMFGGCNLLTNFIGLDEWNTSNVTNMTGMFMQCRVLSDFDFLANWDVSNVTNMYAMFGQCYNLQNVNSLMKWNVGNVIDMRRMFRECTGLINVDGLINWDTSSLENITDIFYECSSLVNVNGLANWNTSRIQYMQNSFWYCDSLSNINGLTNWNVSNVESMSSMFGECASLIDLRPLRKWNTSSVQNMVFMFGIEDNETKVGNAIIDCSPLANWNVSNVTNMAYMFRNNNILSYLAFEKWDVSKVIYFTAMFDYNYSLPSNITSLDGLESWNVESALYMGGMFADNGNLNDASAINNWNINANINFLGMFRGTPVHPEFAQVQGTWDSEGTFTPTV